MLQRGLSAIAEHLVCYWRVKLKPLAKCLLSYVSVSLFILF